MTATACATNNHIYVYGVARTGCEGALPLAACEGVVPGCAVECLRVGGLAAIVSVFPPGAAERKDGVGEGEWARSRAVAHHQVVAALAGRVALAPSKFGTVLRSVDGLVAFIERNAAALEETLDRVSGCREWGLKLFGDPSISRGLAQSSAGVAPMRGELASASEGKSYFIRKKLKLAVEAEAQRMLTARAIEVHQRLDIVARESAHIRSSLKSAGGANAPVMLLNTAYLVETAGEARFHGALDAMRGSFAAAGLSDALTGPWPPYNFVSVSTGAQADV